MPCRLCPPQKRCIGRAAKWEGGFAVERPGNGTDDPHGPSVQRMRYPISRFWTRCENGPKAGVVRSKQYDAARTVACHADTSQAVGRTGVCDHIEGHRLMIDPAP